jgi:hypothetical protein
MKKQYLEKFLRNHLKDEFQILFEIIPVNKEEKRIKSAGLTGRMYLDMLQLGINPFQETLESMLSEAIFSELSEEEQENFYKKE